jgi:hypothetical protein
MRTAHHAIITGHMADCKDNDVSPQDGKTLTYKRERIMSVWFLSIELDSCLSPINSPTVGLVSQWRTTQQEIEHGGYPNRFQIESWHPSFEAQRPIGPRLGQTGVGVLNAHWNLPAVRSIEDGCYQTFGYPDFRVRDYRLAREGALVQNPALE